MKTFPSYRPFAGSPRRRLLVGAGTFILVSLALAAGIVACGGSSRNETASSVGLELSPSAGALPQQCTARSNGVLPDPSCTPGVTDPAVTDANVQQTICVPGYSRRVRPPESVTEPLKRQLMMAYGYGGQSPSNFELDHLISLGLGGASVPGNLWPEPRAGSQGAPAKDHIEGLLHDDVCQGTIRLSDAQRLIASGWPTAAS